jgi:hypothetical protein
MYDALQAYDTNINFFRIYQGCLMDAVCVDWCKVFGSERQNFYWEKFFTDEGAFRKKLDERLADCNLGNFKCIRLSMRNYRDTAAAHLDFNEGKRAKAYPSIEAAKVTAELLYKELYMRLNHKDHHHGHSDPSQIMSVSRDKIVLDNAELLSVCLKALDGWQD